MRFLSRIRAWMVVPVVDFALMVAPLAWRPPQIHAIVTMAVLATLLLTGGGRYVARLHLSVLDELPTIVTRLLTAVAAVSAVILYLHQKAEVLIFLETACQAVVLVIVGRVITTRLIAIGRRSGIAKHHTVLIGGGPVAAELARILAQHREYGLKLDGFVDDGDDCPAEEYLPRLGRLADLDMAVSTTGADTLLVADGSFEERALIDAVRTEACQTRRPARRSADASLPHPDRDGRPHWLHSDHANPQSQPPRAGAADQAWVRHRSRGDGTDRPAARAGCSCAGGADRGWTRRHLPASQSGARRQALRAVEVPFDAAGQ